MIRRILARGLALCLGSALLAASSPHAVHGASPALASTQDSDGSTVSRYLGGTVDAIAVSGHFAYVIVDQALVAVDVSDPSAPREVWRGPRFDSRPTKLLIGNGHLFVPGAMRERILIYDLKRPRRPSLRGVLRPHDYVRDMAIVGDTAYMLGAWDLQIYDISTPARPKKVGSRRPTVSEWTVDGLAVADGVAYITDVREAVLWSVDISNPAVEADVQAYRYAEANPEHDEIWGSPFVVESAGFVFVVSWRWEGEDPAYTLIAIDVRDPTGARKVAWVDLGQYVGDAQLIAGHLVMGNHDELQIVDVSDPSELGSPLVVDGVGGVPFVVHGHVAFMAQDGLRLVDLSSLAKPVEMGRVPTLGGGGSVDIAGNMAFATLGGDLHLYDLALAACPRWVGRLDVEGARHAVEAINGRLFVLQDDALRIFDARTWRPQLLSEIRLADFADEGRRPARYLALDEGRAYLADPDGVRVFDVRDLSQSRELGYVAMPEGVLDLDAAQGHVYAVDRSTRLRIWDVRDPQRARETGAAQLDRPEFSDVAIHVDRGHAYFTNTYQLWIIDVQNVAQPKRGAVLTWSWPGLPPGYIANPTGADITVQEGRAVLAAKGAGLIVADVTDPEEPQMIASHREGGRFGPALGVAYADGHAYLGTSKGLLVHSIGRQPSAAPPQPTPPGLRRPYRALLPTVLNGTTQRCP